MSEPFQVTPVSVDCVDCLLQALHNSGLDWRQPFSVFAQLREMPKSVRHALIDALVDHAEGEAFLIVTAAHLVREDVAHDAEGAEAAPSHAEELLAEAGDHDFSH
ncbi:MAG: hypothetical protein ABR517_00595 [Thermoanaerobaculia bacterium]